MEKYDHSEELRKLYSSLYQSDHVISILMTHWVSTVSGFRFEQHRDMFETARVKRRELLDRKSFLTTFGIKDK